MNCLITIFIGTVDWGVCSFIKMSHFLSYFMTFRRESTSRGLITSPAELIRTASLRGSIIKRHSAPLKGLSHLSSAVVTGAAALKDLPGRCRMPPRPPDLSSSMPAHISHENTCRLVWKREGKSRTLRRNHKSFFCCSTFIFYVSDTPEQQLKSAGLQQKYLSALQKSPQLLFALHFCRSQSLDSDTSSNLHQKTCRVLVCLRNQQEVRHIFTQALLCGDVQG